MSGGGAAPAPELLGPPQHEDKDELRSPMRLARLGSTRKLAAFHNIRSQLSEQSRVLESRAEAAAGIANELHDYCKRRADLEHDYARALDKLARVAFQRHKDQKHKREQWPLTGAFKCWQLTLENTRTLSREHAALGDLYGGRLSTRLQRAADDTLRMHRKCKDIVLDRQDEISGVLAEAGSASKIHAAASAEWRASAGKLKTAYEQQQRVAAAEPPRVKKLKAMDKELEKRRQRHNEARARSLRARTDYLLCLEAANATLHRYYLDDIADIMMCMEVGFEACIGRVFRTAIAAENVRAQAIMTAANNLLGAVDSMDNAAERQHYMEVHAHAFAVPRRIAFAGCPPEQEDEEIAETLGAAGGPKADVVPISVGLEMTSRLAHLESSARVLRAECRENAKTLDAAEAELIRQMEGTDEQWDIRHLFSAMNVGGTPHLSADDGLESARREQEDYYIAKFRSYVCSAGRLARLEAKSTTLRGRLLPSMLTEKLMPPLPADSDTYTPSHSRRYRGAGGRGQFAAPLEEHLAATNRDLPLVLTSCVRVIASYGIRHRGIFRVSGSQVEMQALRAAFERGEDPLASVKDASDINSVAGLLKMYLREMRPPVLPPQLLDRLLKIASTQVDEEFVARMQELIATLPKSSMLVLRYLFGFLAHLSEFSEDNMMDPWNLAICLGPTLLAAWGEGGGGQVTAQNLVNELVKRIIQLQADIFPKDIDPHTVYRPEMFSENKDAEGSDTLSGDELDAGTLDEAAGSAFDPDPELSPFEDDDDVVFYADEVSDDGENDWRNDKEGPINEPDRCESVERQPSTAAPQVREPGSCAPAPPERTVSCTAATIGCRLAEATPDLVLDLPSRAAAAAAGAASPSPAPASVPRSASDEPTDTADTFAHNRDTLKKRPRHKKSSSGDSNPDTPDHVADDEAKPEPREDQPSASGSPVPARNTARVAAKFAELTLTGGSRKPSVAAKPTLTRKPTPHPHHSQAVNKPQPQ